MLRMLDGYVKVHKSVSFNAHVDDFTLDAASPNREALVIDIESAASDLAYILQDRPMLALAAHKACIVASSLELGRRVARALGVLGGTATFAARNLGVDYTAGRAHSRVQGGVKVRNNRLALFRARLGRLRRIRGVTNRAKLFVTGLLPARLWGLDVNGYVPKQIRAFRVAVGKFQGVWVPGRLLHLSWHTARKVQDPVVPAASTFVRYCREW